MFFVCTLSGAKAFAQKGSLTKHVSSVHENNTINKFQCEICDHKASCQVNLNLHIKVVHHKIKDHCCDRCGKRFSCPQALKKHYFKSHSGKDGGRISYKCDFCIGKKFICILGFCEKIIFMNFSPFCLFFVKLRASQSSKINI